MSLYNDPKYKFIRDGKFTTKVILFETPNGSIRKRIQFIKVNDEVKILKPEDKRKSTKKKSNGFIPLF